MLYKVFVSCLSVALWVSTSLKAQTFEWVASGGGAGPDKTRGLNFDHQGNILLAGEMSGDGTFGSLSAKSAGGVDCFVAKTDGKGNFLWATALGGSLIDRGYAVAADESGNVYVTGHYQSPDLMVDGKALPMAGDYDLFLAKYDASGKLLWVKTAGGPGYDYGHGLVIDKKGDVIISGAAGADAKFGDVTLKGPRSVFCAKYDASGTLLWVKGSEGKASCSGHGVAVDDAGNIYVGGLASGAGSFGGQRIDAPGRTDGLVIKLSPDGEAQWLRQTTGAPSALFHDITADGAGRVWAVGMFKGSLQAGRDTWTTTQEKDNDGLVVHYDPEGNVKWTRVIQSPTTDYMLGAAPDGKGGVFVTGEHGSKAILAGETLATTGGTGVYVIAYNAAGEKQWILSGGGPKASNAYVAAFDGKSGLIVGGGVTGAGAFGQKAAGVTSGADLYAVKMKVPQ